MNGARMNSQPIGGNDDVAERVRAERERRGWSYRDLAAAMAQNGGSASKDTLQRIEYGNPRPKIGVDQLVTFAKVFDLTVEELLAPAAWVRQRRVDAMVRQVQAAAEKFEQGIVELIDCWRRLDWLASDEFEEVSRRVNLGEFKLTIPSAAGLEEAATVVLALTQMLGSELVMQRYRGEVPIAYPDMVEKIEIPVETVDWPRYLEQLEADLDGFLAFEPETATARKRSTR